MLLLTHKTSCHLQSTSLPLIKFASAYDLNSCEKILWQICGKYIKRLLRQHNSHSRRHRLACCSSSHALIDHCHLKMRPSRLKKVEKNFALEYKKSRVGWKYLTRMQLNKTRIKIISSRKKKFYLDYFLFTYLVSNLVC